MREAVFRDVLWCARQMRRGALATRFAVEAGFANVSRLRVACLVTQRAALEEVEWRLVQDIAQKFLEELAGVKREAAPEIAEARAFGEQLIKEACAEVLRMRRERLAG